jgi:hypothetical protein
MEEIKRMRDRMEFEENERKRKEERKALSEKEMKDANSRRLFDK